MKNKLQLLFFGLMLTYMLSSCVTSKHTDLLQNIPKDYPTVVPCEYRIIPGDQLAIAVYAVDKKIERQFRAYAPNYTWAQDRDAITASNDQIRYREAGRQSKPLRVYADGTINFPYLGKIYVQGFTILEAQKYISEKLASYAEGTTAEVSLSNNYFSVLGETGAQRIGMSGTRMTIYQALATANTIGTYGNRSKVSIIRQTADGTVLLKEFDLRSKDIIDSEYYYIQPNDVIYFPQMKRKFFGGTDSFAGTISLITLFTGIVVYAAKLF